MNRPSVVVLLGVSVAACDGLKEDPHFVKLGPAPLPRESFEKPPSTPLEPGSLLIYPENMTCLYNHPGEAGYYAFGGQYGFDSLSFVITETHPGGGPPLHTHSVEEAHVLLSGTMEYVIGDKREGGVWGDWSGHCAKQRLCEPTAVDLSGTPVQASDLRFNQTIPLHQRGLPGRWRLAIAEVPVFLSDSTIRVSCCQFSETAASEFRGCLQRHESIGPDCAVDVAFNNWGVPGFLW